jgi:valyl-tRNA synthetase
MSKSLGNGVDPRDIIHSHGADALRFTLTQMATATQDVRMPVDTVCPHCGETFHPKEITSPAGYRVAAPEQACPACKGKLVTAYGVAAHAAEPVDEAPLARNSSSRFDQGRNFCNKLWNATRFALTRLGGAPADEGLALDDVAIIDRWIINRLHSTLHAVEDALADYQFSAYAEAMYDFIWRDFCDWYLEGIKATVADRPKQQQVLRTVLNAILRLLHPICPFVTEALWGPVQATGAAGVDGIALPASDLLAAAAWPDIACRVHDNDAAATFERGQGLVNAIRGLRAQYNVPPRKQITLHVTPACRALIESLDGVVEALAGLETLATIEERSDGAIPLAFEGDELALGGLVDAVDLDAERARLQKLVAEKEKAIAGFRGRLGNEGYVKNARPEVVEETRARLAEAEADLEAARGALVALGA